MLVEATGLGVVIGVLLGALGGGGGVLVVPALVYVLGQSGQDATTSSIIIVGLTAGAGAVQRLRAGELDWRMSLVFGALGIPGAYLGTRLNHLVSQHVLMLAFAGVTLVAALAMFAGNREDREGGRDGEGDAAGGPGGDPAGDVRTSGSSGGGTTLLVAAPPAERRAPRRVVKIVACALGIGFMTGFLGVGGGFLVVPALVIALAMPMELAVGASLMIITLNSVSSLAARIGDTHFDWHIVVPFTLAAIMASVAGTRIADRFSGETLMRAFSVLLVLVAGLVAAQSLGAF
jgi:uncharacterized membrane protein YfcA